MARSTVRYTKKGPRITTRYKIGKTTVTVTSGGGKKTKKTTRTRGSIFNWSRSS